MQAWGEKAKEAVTPDPTGFHFTLHDRSLPYCRLFLDFSEQLQRENLVFCKVVRELGRAHTLKRWPVEITIGNNAGWTQRLGRAVEQQGYKCHTIGTDENRTLVITLN